MHFFKLARLSNHAVGGFVFSLSWRFPIGYVALLTVAHLRLRYIIRNMRVNEGVLRLTPQSCSCRS